MFSDRAGPIIGPLMTYNAIQIPRLSSLILKHDLNAPLAGLDTMPEAERPPVGIVFWAFRLMVGLGLLMAALGALSLLARARGSGQTISRSQRP